MCAPKKDNRLIVNRPDLAKEWNVKRNTHLELHKVTAGSSKKAWWVCSKGHEWEAVIVNRTKGSGCSICSGKKVHPDTCLATLNPTLSKEWHPTKNGTLTANHVTPGSSKKVWWMCSKGHEWETVISNRNSGKGCPVCSGRKVHPDTCLATVNPPLVKEWHPMLNGTLTPNQVTSGSSKKVWWLCSKGHEWKAQVSSRNQGKGCPVCSGKKVHPDNCLATVNPLLAKEWHPSLNGNLLPNQFTPGSSEKAWWLCSKGHEWESEIGSRSRGRGCPTCIQGLGTSFPEQAIYFYIKQVFPSCINRYIYPHTRMELDIYIPGINVGIEYDGQHYHQDKEKDERKNRFFKGKISLLRVRETKAIKLDVKDPIFYVKSRSDADLEQAIHQLLLLIGKGGFLSIDIKRDRMKIHEMTERTEKEYSLEMFPLLVKEWHPTRNERLLPNQFTPGSSEKAWWLCSKGHEWESEIGSRSQGSGCPVCSGQKVHPDNCLATVQPHLAKEWHPSLNGTLTPSQVTSGSAKKAWWFCSKGHEWKAMVNKRTRGTGCPVCSGKQVHPDTCLLTIHPVLAKEWHPTKNGTLTPSQVTPGSSITVWWKCSNGDEWKARIKDRSNGLRTCRECKKRQTAEKRIA